MSDSPVDSIKAQLLTARQKLTTTSDSPVLDAELLLGHCIGKNQTYLHTWPEKTLSSSQLEQFEQLIDKRCTDYPVAYLIGTKDFWTLNLKVTPDVLIPRPETELLVEIALDTISKVDKPKILDLGTGSGAIALALASERKNAEIIACDYSSKAISVAEENMSRNNLKGRVKFVESNWFQNIQENDYDLIVSNPPYIDPEDPHLLESIKYEPLQALVAKNKGLDDLDIIITDSKNHLKEGGFLILEHGYDQDLVVLELLRKAGYTNEKNIRDLNHNPRVSFATIS